MHMAESKHMGPTNTLKPVFCSKKTYLSCARKHLKVMKCKDVKYLKYFEKECHEKIENREVAPKKQESIGTISLCMKLCLWLLLQDYMSYLNLIINYNTQVITKVSDFSVTHYSKTVMQ